jgi:hypothetical protein
LHYFAVDDADVGDFATGEDIGDDELPRYCYQDYCCSYFQSVGSPDRRPNPTRGKIFDLKRGQSTLKMQNLKWSLKSFCFVAHFDAHQVYAGVQRQRFVAVVAVVVVVAVVEAVIAAFASEFAFAFVTEFAFAAFAVVAVVDVVAFSDLLNYIFIKY